MALPKISENLQKRILSAGVLVPILLGIIYAGGAWFSTLVAFAAVIMSFEWYGIVSSKEKEDVDNATRKKWLNYGVVYIGIFVSSLLFLRNMENGLGVVMLALMVVWATDIVAYFAGSLIKGPKIYPAISPNKTWAGLAGGMAAAAMVGAFGNVFIHSIEPVTMIVACALLAVVSQAGDFFESFVKRKFGVKDSGNIIPGHGGILDRVDGLMTVMPVFALLSQLNGGILL